VLLEGVASSEMPLRGTETRSAEAGLGFDPSCGCVPSLTLRFSQRLILAPSDSWWIANRFWMETPSKSDA
jgi:hypothetical protein